MDAWTDGGSRTLLVRKKSKVQLMVHAFDFANPAGNGGCIPHSSIESSVENMIPTKATIMAPLLVCIRWTFGQLKNRKFGSWFMLSTLQTEPAMEGASHIHQSSCPSSNDQVTIMTPTKATTMTRTQAHRNQSHRNQSHQPKPPSWHQPQPPSKNI